MALIMAGGFSLAQAANMDKGKALFESPTLGGGTTGKSCMSCHTSGKKLAIKDMNDESLTGAVNACIEKALGGKAIDPKGQEMQDLTAYMRKL